jgi:hypothetical protein
MKNSYALILVLLLFCSGSYAQKNKIVFNYNETKNETYIQNLYQIDTLKLKGFWQKIDSNKKSHSITIKDSIITLEFFPYPKKNRDFLKPGMSKPQLLNAFVNSQSLGWRYLGLKYEILKTNILDYKVFKFRKEIVLLGIKGENTFYLSMKYNRKVGFIKEFNELLSFFEKTIIL